MTLWDNGPARALIWRFGFDPSPRTGNDHSLALDL